ncbi:MAG TPA: patatin-like phospholipase family protein, partial [Erysipelothrix sp.]|nr:patatin-like phospholipase family protein [Erysipelothrix sp.]
ALECDAQTIKKEMLELEQYFEDNNVFFKPSKKLLPFSDEKITGGYIDGLEIETKLEEVFAKYGATSIRDVKIPLAIPAVDIVTGKLIVFVNDKKKYTSVDPNHVVIDDISLAKAVRSSASIPFIFSSVLLDDYQLVDGGVKLNVPLPLLKGFSNHKTLAIITKKEIEPFEKNGIVPLAMQVYNINGNEFDHYIAREADHFINFPLGRITFSLGKGEEIINRAKNHLDKEDKVIDAIKKDKSILSFLE